jgi:hypothetical protein
MTNIENVYLESYICLCKAMDKVCSATTAAMYITAFLVLNKPL